MPIHLIKKIRLLVVEDNRLLRDGITTMLKEQPDLTVVATFGTGENVVQKIVPLKPNIVLLDLGLRSQNSLEMVRSIRKKSKEVRVIVMDLVPTEADILDFVKAGVSGFLLKDATINDFLKTIRSVAHGTKVLPTHLTTSLFSQIVDHAISGREPSKLI